MSTTKKIQSALISVFSKDGLEPIVRKLHEQNVVFYSTGGTEEYIKNLGIPVIPVEDVTSYPSILGGRVKTLHPKVFGGILNRQDNESDVQQMKEYEIPQIDLVIVDLYPFEKTVASGASDSSRKVAAPAMRTPAMTSDAAMSRRCAHWVHSVSVPPAMMASRNCDSGAP